MSSSPSTQVSESAFRRACGQFATGVAIAATVDAEGVPHGLTVNSFTSVSLAPALVLVCIDYRATALKHFLAASHYGISVLSETQRETSNRFATNPECRFETTEWRRGQTGVPLIHGSLATLECRMHRIVEGGDHTILIGEAIAVHISGGDPLLYFNGAYASLAQR